MSYFQVNYIHIYICVYLKKFMFPFSVRLFIKQSKDWPKELMGFQLVRIFSLSLSLHFSLHFFSLSLPFSLSLRTCIYFTCPSPFLSHSHTGLSLWNSVISLTLSLQETNGHVVFLNYYNTFPLVIHSIYLLLLFLILNSILDKYVYNSN